MEMRSDLPIVVGSLVIAAENLRAYEPISDILNIEPKFVGFILCGETVLVLSSFTSDLGLCRMLHSRYGIVDVLMVMHEFIQMI